MELLLDNIIYDIVADEDFTKSKQIRSTPLIKLVKYGNYNDKNFHKSDMDELIDYYKAIYNHIDNLSNCSLAEKILILYELEVNLRFETFFEIVKFFVEQKITDAKAYYKARGFAMYRTEMDTIQNMIYFGGKKYIQCFCENIVKGNYKIIEDMCIMSSIIFSFADKLNLTDTCVEFTYDCVPMENLKQEITQMRISDKSYKRGFKSKFIKMYYPDEDSVFKKKKKQINLFNLHFMTD